MINFHASRVDWTAAQEQDGVCLASMNAPENTKLQEQENIQSFAHLQTVQEQENIQSFAHLQTEDRSALAA
jgi:hypothetical protein